MIKFLRNSMFKNLSSFFYAIAITLGIYIAIQEIHKFNNFSNFVFFSLAILTIYCLEIFTSYQSKSSKVEINLDIHDEVNELSHFFHKLILPVLLYISIIGFATFYYTDKFLYPILAIAFVIFYILILNTKAFLQNQFSIEHKTHYVYDIIKFVIFFLLINTIANLHNSLGLNIFIATFLAILLSVVILSLMLWRIEKIRKKTIFFSVLASILIGLVFYLVIEFMNLNPLQLSLNLIFLFYITTALIHHKLMGTLTKSVILEYIIVIGLVAAISYGIV